MKRYPLSNTRSPSATAYTKPFTVRINQRALLGEEPIDFICSENQQFRRRVKID